MITYAMMAILVICMLLMITLGLKIDKGKNVFMSVDDTAFLRGVWCIVIIFVHTPAAYQNRIQDLIGSFAYVGVTFFFLTSGYGLRYSVENKMNYGKRFWRNRLPSILIPAVIANVIYTLVSGLKNSWSQITFWSFININAWVKGLLLLYFLFWLIYIIAPKFIKTGVWQDILICSIILCLSLLERFTSIHAFWGWVVEPLGFGYGIVIARNKNRIQIWLQNKWIFKCIVFLLVSLILGVAYLRFKPVFFFGDYLIKMLLGIALTVLIFEILCGFRVGNIFNLFLSKISYEIYLIHGAVFAFVSFVKSDLDSGVYILISIIFSVAFAWVIHKCTQPCINSLKGISNNESIDCK